MVTFNFVNLIQSSTVTLSVLGGFLLWRIFAFRGVAILLLLVAVASTINILEESGLMIDGFLLSPIFILLFAPTTYLAAKFALQKALNSKEWLHFLPAFPLLFFTSHVQEVIAVGSLWRLVYAYFTILLLMSYNTQLASERSDSDEFSLHWFKWLVVVTTLFNLVDLVRLNVQPLISLELNILGQGLNNGVWLIATGIVIYQFTAMGGLPNINGQVKNKENTSSADNESYKAIFEQLDTLMKKNQWYLTPRLTLAQVSEKTGLQTRDISRAINLHSHSTFNEYINRFRIEAVCEQLTNHWPKSITDLAFDAGFSSKASFNKVFKSLHGITPSEYKKGIKSRL